MYRLNRNRNSISGFTLIELLVVIAIIAILAAILFPVFAKVRDKARQTACLSDLKQMGLAMAQYTQDFDETYVNGTYKFGAIGGWAGQLYPYVKSYQVYRCPNDIKVILPADRPTSYGMNSNFGKQGNNNSGIPNIARTVADLTSPAKTVLLYEVEGNHDTDVTTYWESTYTFNSNSSPFGNGKIGGYSPSGGGTFNTCPPNAATGETLKFATGYFGGENPALAAAGDMTCHYTGVTGRHADGSNFLLADFHAKWLRGSSVSPAANAANENAAQVFNPGNGGTAAGTNGTINGVQAAATFSIF